MPFLMALASSVLYGAADFLGGIGSRRGHVVVVTAWFQVAGVLPLVLYAALSPGVTRPDDLYWGAAAGVTGGIGVLLLYHALASGVLSTAAPLISMIALTVPVVFGLSGGERPGVWPLVGIALGCVAVMLISAHGEPAAGESGGAPRRPRRLIVSALAPAFGAGVLIGLFLVCLGRVQPGSSGWPLVMGRATATVCVFALLFVRRLPLRPPAGTHAPIVGGALTDVSANVLYLLAVQRAPMSLIATLVSLAPATTVVLAQFVLREKLGTAQRWGVALALVAVVLLSRG
jgi:drug/metabolite transporter (DMT)-like permease